MPDDAGRDPSDTPRVSIIVANYNGAHLLETCLRSLQALDYPQPRYEILVVDNGSTDRSEALVRQSFTGVRWIAHSMNHYSRALNVGISLSFGDLVVFLNNDTVVDPQWLIELVMAMQRDPRIGACGGKILLMDGRINSAGHLALPDFYWVDRGVDEPDHGQYDSVEDVESLTGCAMLVRRRALDDVGWLDEDFVMYMEDVDLSYRLRQRGWRLSYVPTSLVRHVLHGTKNERSSEEWTERNRLLFIAKHAPKQLGQALFGRGYWAYPRQPQPGMLLRIMPAVLDKLAKHHGIEKAHEVLRDVFEQLHRAQNAEFVSFSQDRAAQLTALRRFEAQLFTMREETANLTRARQALATELARVYESQTYRYLARPLWRLRDRMKRLALRAQRQSVQKAGPVSVTQSGSPDAVGPEQRTLAGCTIISKNYLSYARVLCQSFLERHPGARFFVLLVDKLDGYFDPSLEPFELVQLEEVGIPHLRRFCFQYTVVELNTAVKPYFLERLFEHYGMQKVIFLDPDILVFRSLTHVIEPLDRYWIVLTPHLTAPLEEDGCKPSELTILQAGTFNLGFIALRKTATTQTFLKWWQDRLYTKCEMAPERGMLVDQKWIDLVPGFFDGVSIVRDPGYNVAYWNLAQRPVTVQEGTVMVAGSSCAFMHFSGLQLDQLEEVSKHQNRFTLSHLGDAAIVFKRYRQLLYDAGYHQTSAWPYAFGSFENGVRIPEVVRKFYLSLGDTVRAFGDPFHISSPFSFFHWLNQSVDSTTSPDLTVTRLWRHIYAQRPDVQHAYPNLLGKDRSAFLGWGVTTGRFELGIAEHFLPRLSSKSAPGHRSLLSRIYRRVIRPLEPTATPILRRFFRARPRVWKALKGWRYRWTYEPVMARQSAVNDRRHDPAPFGVNVAGYVRSEKGMGESVRSSMRALSAVGIAYEATQIVDTGSLNTHPTASSDKHPYAINLIHVNADQVPFVAGTLGRAFFEGRYNIGYWTWELSEFPMKWRRSFEYFDEIWVPSQFVLEAIARVSPIPVVRVPHSIAVEEGSGNPNETPPLRGHGGRFRFLFMFDFMSTWQRKNPFGVLEAFRCAFPSDEAEVELVIKTMHAGFAPHVFQRLQQANRGNRISVVDAAWNRTQVLQALRSCDCVVSLHRSEGFGLLLAEAMALGKPVIATNYSGNLDFMTPENSLLVDYRLVELTEDHGPYQRGNQWADPHLEHAAELMRWVVAHPEEVRAIGCRAAETIRVTLSPRAVGALTRQRLETLQDGGAAAPATTTVVHTTEEQPHAFTTP